MTPTQQKAIETALEALIFADATDEFYEYNEEITALRAALAEQDDAIKAAWLAGYTEGEKAAWAEQDDDKADMTIKLPPLPHWCESGSPFAQQMEAYAREAVRLNMAPLSDEQIKKVFDSMESAKDSPWFMRFARAIEAAHGIKGD